MTAGLRDDPLPGFFFEVSLIESTTTIGGLFETATAVLGVGPAASFQRCSGLEGMLDVESYEEGGANGFVHQFRTRVKWSNIVLSRGMTEDQELFDWFAGFAEGRGERRNGLITLRDHDPKREVTYGFRDGMPVKLTLPPLHAQESSVAIETVEIAHHGVYRLPGGDGIVGAAATALDAIF